MDLQRMHSILSNKEKCDVFYGERPVWVQEIHNDMAKVGFIDTFEEKDVLIQDLSENFPII